MALSVKRALLFVLLAFALAFASGGAADTSGTKEVLSEAQMDGFDSEVINSLFGTSGEKRADSAAAADAGYAFASGYRVLISKPVYAAAYSGTSEKWVSAAAEIFAYCKVSALPGARVYTMEEVNGVMHHGWRGFDTKLSRPHFIEAAKKLGATHVLYQEFHPDASGTRSAFSMELYDVKKGAVTARASNPVEYFAFERGLDKSLTVIVDAIDAGIKETEAFKMPVYPGGERRHLEAFGKALVIESAFTKDRSAAAYAAAEGIIKNHDGMRGVHYASALLAERAGRYQNALLHLNAAANISGDRGPHWQLQAARIRRKAGHHTDALRIALAATSNPALKTPAAIEIALTYSAMGQPKRSVETYRAIVKSGDADGRVFFRLAHASAEQGRLAESEVYLQAAAKAGLTLLPSEYTALGIAYGKTQGGEKKGLEYLMRSVAANPGNEEGWLAIAEIHTRSGNTVRVADAYVSLFKANPSAHKQRLKVAGSVYVKAGMDDKAREAYKLFVAQKFEDRDVAVGLARIYQKEEKCEELPRLLRPYNTDPEAVKLFEACGFVSGGGTKRGKKK